MLGALTERQMQFWEEVEEGLESVKRVYGGDGDGDGKGMDRIMQFVATAKGERPAPVGSGEGHEPSEEHIEGLTAQPLWDVMNDEEEDGRFPWASELEEQWEMIGLELEVQLQLQQQQESERGIFSGDSAWQNGVMGSGWTAFRLQRLGQWNADNCDRFPKTYNLLRQLDIPFAVRGVCFARQTPNTGVLPHSDGRNFILTSHLGLKVPKDDTCYMTVANERTTWQEGKLLTLDTSFTHSTRNDHPTEDRHVLIIDFWHPQLTSLEIASLEFIYDLRNKFESGKIPYRKPKALIQKEQAEQSFAGIWNSLFSNSK